MSSVLLAGSHSTCVSESSVIWRHEKPKGPAGRSRHHSVTAQGVCAVSNLFQRPGVGSIIQPPDASRRHYTNSLIRSPLPARALFSAYSSYLNIEPHTRWLPFPRSSTEQSTGYTPELWPTRCDQMILKSTVHSASRSPS